MVATSLSSNCAFELIHFLTALPESPFVGAPGFRIAKINQTMIAFLKLGGMLWATRFFQVNRRCYRNNSCVEEFSRYKRRWTGLAETDGKVEAFCDQIAQPVTCNQFELECGKPF
jgi:hypothetical protein